MTHPTYPALAKAVDGHIAKMRDCRDEDRPEDVREEIDRDTSELVRVLFRILSGRHPIDAFGCPGDWFYGTPFGDAWLADNAKENGERKTEDEIASASCCCTDDDLLYDSDLSPRLYDLVLRLNPDAYLLPSADIEEMIAALEQAAPRLKPATVQ